MIRPLVCYKPPMCGRATISAAGYITTKDEKQWLTRIVQKSELAKSYVPQRGKKK